MAVYYNEWDPFMAQWLRNLIKVGHLLPGDVDERDIREIAPDDLRGYTQHHFFAGIGGWAVALSLAGWPADRPVWTGSCPCQPFSAAGKRRGEKDERHLWPAWLQLIRECQPSTVFGEQVASPLGREWLSGVRADLETVGYAVGAADLCAAGVGSPQIRQRLWWVADSEPFRRRGRSDGNSQGEGGPLQTEGSGSIGRLPNTDIGGDQCQVEREEIVGKDTAGPAGGAGGCGSAGGVSDARGNRREQGTESVRRGQSKPPRADEIGGIWDSHKQGPQGCGPILRSGSLNGADCEQISPTSYWSDFDILPFQDGKARRVESGTFPLVAGLSSSVVPDGDPSVSYAQATAEARVMRLKGYGNSIVPQNAAVFIRACQEVMGLG